MLVIFDTQSNMLMPDAKILVADDNALIVSLIRFAVRDLPVQVFGASSGTRALDLMREQQYSLIISDWVMPGMSGREFIRECRRHPQHATTPVIVVSGYDERSSAMAAGAARFIPKPFTAYDVAACVCELLQVRSQPGAASGQKTG
jgi:CheY-like chemotaxis protein